MGDIGDFWKEEKEEYKKRCEKRNDNYEPRLINIGAIKKSYAVYDFDGFLCYPTKGFAMNKKNTDIRVNLNKFLTKYESKE